ncbi:MAG: hypothetical protein Q9219_002872 [cf. Caloplaca sp. 3 TL-2023]
MDPLKLLSRSSNLQRSNQSGGVGVYHVPSAADSTRIERKLNTDVQWNGEASRGQKRKRSTKDTMQSYQTIQTASGMDRRSEIANIIHDIPRPITNIVGQQEQHTQEKSVADTSNREERWKLLKQNRVKITLLESRSHSDVLFQSEDETRPRMKKGRAQLISRPLQSMKHIVTEFNVSKKLGHNLDAQGYVSPTEVQLGTIPLLIGTDHDRGLEPGNDEGSKDSRRSNIDLLTVAPTGSGKTLAFLIHLLHNLQDHHRESKTKQGRKTRRTLPRALILAPTHELVDQIVAEAKRLASGTGVRISRLRRGINLGSKNTVEETANRDTAKDPGSDFTDTRAPRSSMLEADIIVSTPMLLLRAATPNPESTSSPMADIHYLVLDEADVLLDPLFRTQTLEIWTLCTNSNLQTSLWSATIGSSIETLARDFILHRWKKLGLEKGPSNHHIIRVVVGLKDSAIPNISHRLVYAATERGKLMALRQLINPTGNSASEVAPLQPPFLVFTQTIQRAVALHSELLYDVPVEAGGSSRIALLHSDLTDKIRSTIISGFRKGDIWILITTDLLARGVDFRGVNGVVNYDIPSTSGTYVHRVGRTGRQGRAGGIAVTLYTKEDIKYVKNVANVIAASERQEKSTPDGQVEHGSRDWLLKALPDVSKKTKLELKQKGVGARRKTIPGKDSRRTARQMRISTKSGYDRAMKHKRKGAATEKRRQSMKESPEEGWEGIQD